LGVRDEPIGVLGTDGFAAHQALLFRQWSSDVVLFLHTGPEPTAEDATRLEARDVGLVRGEVAALEIDGDRLTGVRMRSGEVVPRRAIVVRPRFVARTDLLAGLGVAAVEHPAGVGVSVPTDPLGHTGVPGVYAAGNITDLFANVLSSAAAGAFVAAAINADLIDDDAGRAVVQRAAAQWPGDAARAVAS
jgi:thioredoxin reductase